MLIIFHNPFTKNLSFSCSLDGTLRDVNDLKFNLAVREFQKTIHSGEYKKIYLIEWNKEDDRTHRREILFLVGGAYTGLFKNLFETGGAWFDKLMDDLGQETVEWEESDEIAESELNELRESIQNYHPIYSYKATANSNRIVFFIIGKRKRKFIGLNKYDVTMITDRYQFYFENDLKIRSERTIDDPKLFHFSTLIHSRLMALEEKMKKLEYLKSRFYYEEK